MRFLSSIKRSILRRRFVDNFFRGRSGWPIVEDCPTGNTMLVIAPHWDDPIIACYGTLLIGLLKGKKVDCWSIGPGPEIVDYPTLAEPPVFSNYSTVLVTAPWDEHKEHVKAIHNIPVSFPGEVWLYQVYENVTGNAVIDISAVAYRKLQALMKMQTCLPDNRDWVHYTMSKDGFTSRHLHCKDARFAEMFTVIKDFKAFYEAWGEWDSENR